MVSSSLVKKSFYYVFRSLCYHESTLMPPDLTRLETEAMRMLLDGEDPVLTILRAQYDHSCVKTREYTGVGFYTRFSVPETVPRVTSRKSFTFDDVHAEIEGLESGACFMLLISDGVIDFLEGAAYGESWPSQSEHFTFTYISKGQRDMDTLRKEWTDGRT